MELLFGFFLPCLYAFFGCLAFCVVLGQRKALLVPSALGGSIGWGVYLLLAPAGSDILQYFMGAIAVAVYAEIMARVFKAPSTGFLVGGILPLVPGGGIYYTMEYCLAGDTMLFLTTGIHTLGVAGSMAVGLLLVSSLVRMFRRGLAAGGGRWDAEC